MEHPKNLIDTNTVKNWETSIAASNLKGWYKKNDTRYWPTKSLSLNKIDSVSTELFNGYGPSSPIFNSNSKIMTMGSCFALRIREWMNKKQKQTQAFFVPEGLNNSFAVRQFIEWSLTGDKSQDAYWYDENTNKEIIKWHSDEEQIVVKEKFTNYDGFIITFGLSEVWRDKITKGVFWRGVPNNIFDPDKHECIISTVEENYLNMKRIIDLIHTYCGEKPIIFTLSPVPLNATFQERSCIVSDCISKSILRIAIEMIEKEKIKNFYYWPSFEFIKWLPSHCDIKTFGSDPGVDSRHVSNWAVESIINNFSSKFFTD